jgi:two-component system chemotaxis response regulator CheB
MNSLIRILIVDDSAFIRKVVREILSRSPYLEVVGAARDGQEALDMAEELKPDVVTCDLMMPRLDGLGFVREQLVRRRLPILILTASPQDGERAIEAMDAGAVDFIQKPSALANDDILSIRDELVEKVKAAARAPMLHVPPTQRGAQAVSSFAGRALKVDIVVIGISTGGPQGLRYMIPQLPADFPVPVAMVLHMPVGYTQLYAAKLDELSELKVIEAREGEVLRPGVALLAQAGRHLILRRVGANVVAQLAFTPLDTLHRPSADVLFKSAVETYGGRVLAVVMTGMGSDGCQGAAWVKAQGGTVLTEAEESCVIYGMPRSVVEAGLSDAAVPLNRMAQAIMEQL